MKNRKERVVGVFACGLGAKTTNKKEKGGKFTSWRFEGYTIELYTESSAMIRFNKLRMSKDFSLFIFVEIE
jgi:hypothetical protein